jgi:hypothetical protein
MCLQHRLVLINPVSSNIRRSHTARKLKQDWVERQKIKSKWKAQKRREGLVTALPSTRAPVEDNEEDDKRSDAAVTDGPDELMSDAEDAEPENPRMQKKAPHPARATPVAKHRKTLISHNDDGSHDESSEEGKDAAVDGPLEDKKVNLREMARQAYSSSSLHTYRANPLHKRGGASGGRGRGRGIVSMRGRDDVGRGGRGRGNVQGNRGRGQPNMRLRMNVMLEKIKRDFA